MKLGIILPSFASDASEALAAARLAEGAGVGGVFCFDHLWPINEPGKPAISPYPLLGALCEVTSTVRLGTLVSRVGLVPEDVLTNELWTLHTLSGGRFIASLGTGDHLSAAENLAYGVPFEPAEQRRSALGRIAAELVHRGLDVWIGGGQQATNELAHSSRATLNLWGVSPDRVRECAAHGRVSWAGRFPKEHEKATDQLRALDDAGATWAVYIWPGDLAPVLAAAEAADIELG